LVLIFILDKWEILTSRLAIFFGEFVLN